MRASNVIALAAALGATLPDVKLPTDSQIRKMAKRRTHILQHNSGDPIKVAAQPGRNDKCPCGTGKKYKSCCIHRPPLKEIVDVTMAEKVESRLQGDV